MKKIALCTFLSLSTVFAAEGIKYEIEPTIGYNSFDSASKMKSSFVYGIRGTAYLDNYYGYRLSYERADDVHYSNSSTFTKKTTDLQRISGQILVNGEEEFNVIPYLFFGGGYEMLSEETSFDVSQGYVEGGIGFKYHAYNNIQLNLEAKALKKFDTDDVDTVVQLGFGYLLDPATPSSRRGFLPSIFKRSKKSNDSLDLPTLEALEDLEPTPEEFQQVVQVKTPEVAQVKTPEVAQVRTPEVVQDVEVSSSAKAAYTFEEEGTTTQSSTVYDDTAVVEYSQTPQVEAVEIEDNMYYVQMAAWFKDENPKLLDRLVKTSYPFEVVQTVRKNRDVKVVVVGPFVDMKEAKQAYRSLRKIKRDAFITKLN